MIEINNKEEFEKVLSENTDKLVVAKFWATWCGPCKVLSKTIEDNISDFPNVIFVGVNIEDADEDFVNESKVRNIPFLQFFKNGNLVDKSVGALSLDALKNKINEAWKK